MTAAKRGGALLVLVCVSACAVGKKDAEEVPRLGPLNWQGASEKSRCEFRGRQDRDVVESMAPGAPRPNILRVYGYVGTGEERRRVLLCREVDTNFDGQKDVLRTYGDNGEKLRELADVDFDGKVDTWITFGPSGPVQVEFDKNGDGRADEIRIYSHGKLVRVKLDSNNDGKADIFENYENERLVRMGLDTDFDGSVDVWRRDTERAGTRPEKDDEEAGQGEGSPPNTPDAPAE